MWLVWMCMRTVTQTLIAKSVRQHRVACHIQTDIKKKRDCYFTWFECIYGEKQGLGVLQEDERQLRQSMCSVYYSLFTFKFTLHGSGKKENSVSISSPSYCSIFISSVAQVLTFIIYNISTTKNALVKIIIIVVILVIVIVIVINV